MATVSILALAVTIALAMVSLATVSTRSEEQAKWIKMHIEVRLKQCLLELQMGQLGYSGVSQQSLRKQRSIAKDESLQWKVREQSITSSSSLHLCM